jgi:hypothetical protein
MFHNTGVAIESLSQSYDNCFYNYNSGDKVCYNKNKNRNIFIL